VPVGLSPPDHAESTPVDSKQKRRAKNQALFREVNDRVEEVLSELADYGQADARLIGFVCECGRDDCSDELEVTRAQYESVRDDPRCFLLLPGHEHPDIERVVERHSGFLVVEKLAEAAEIAVEHDPRP
jgi:hypothetical protein